MASPLSVKPSAQTMQTTEILTFTFDFSQVLQPGQTLASCTATLTDTTGGGSIPVVLADACAVVDVPPGTANGVKQILRGAALLAQHTYRLSITGVVSSTLHWTGPLTVTCPF